MPAHKSLPSGLCFIVGGMLCELTVIEAAEAALKAGVKWIQYRQKELPRRRIYEEAARLRVLTRDYGAALTVNDHADIAAATDAEGVHLGQEDLPLKEARKVVHRRIAGISTHSLPEAKKAEKEGADYIGFGPVFHTTTKDAGIPVGLDALREIKKNIKIPVVAIGGITPENLPQVFAAGADAVAAASAIIKGDIQENIKRFLQFINRTVNK